MASQLPRFIGAGELRDLLSVREAIDALRACFSADPLPQSPPRSHVDVDGATLLLMPASGDAGSGVKLVTVTPSNPARGKPLIHALYVLFSPRSLEPVAVVEGGELTALRTSAVSGLATDLLARPDATRLVVFGAGVQAHAHVVAMTAVRPIASVVIVSRTRTKAEELVDRARSMGLDATVDEPSAMADADIVCTCTTSRSPLFDGARLQPGAHVNAVGAFERDARELDDATMRRATVVVETKEAALAEAGDVVIPLRDGLIRAEDLSELGDVVRGSRGRSSADEITVFKSVGVAFEDLVVARAAVEKIPSA